MSEPNVISQSSNSASNPAPTDPAEIPAATEHGRAISVAPNIQLGRRGLILLLIGMAAFGISIYSLFPDAIGGPPLPVEVQIGKELIATASDGKVATPSVVVINQADHPIKHVHIILNGHYLLARQSPLKPGERLVLPQAIFTDKRSSRRFNPNYKPIEKVVVRGQLPSGTRGVSLFEFGP